MKRIRITAVVTGSSTCISKYAAEAVTLSYAAKGLDVVVVNPAAVIAPGGEPGSSRRGGIQAVRDGRLIAYPFGGVGVVTCHDMV
jgi:dihydroflavonol-4-reductase